MATVKHPAFDDTREVPDSDVAQWVAAGWLHQGANGGVVPKAVIEAAKSNGVAPTTSSGALVTGPDEDEKPRPKK